MQIDKIYNVTVCRLHLKFLLLNQKKNLQKENNIKKRAKKGKKTDAEIDGDHSENEDGQKTENITWLDQNVINNEPENDVGKMHWMIISKSKRNLTNKIQEGLIKM